MKKEELIKLVEEALELRAGQVDETTSSENCPEWDSLGQLVVLSKLKESLGSEFKDFSGLASLNSIQKLCDYFKVVD